MWNEVFVVVKGAIFYMNKTSNVLWLGTICWITKHPFNFYKNLLNFPISSFLMSQGVHMIDSRITIHSKYWSHFINIEQSVLASLRWYIKVVFLHEGVYCPGVVLNLQNLQQHHVMMETNRIFDLCYHADKYTSFVITDHKSCCHMKGCHGKIVCYYSLQQQYNVSITSNNANQSEGYMTALPAGVMEPTYVLREERNPSSYHLSRRDTQTSTTKVIQLKLPKPSSVEPISIPQINEVKCCFWNDVFELVRQVDIHPEQVANGSLKELFLKELEKAQNKYVAESAKISIDRQDFESCYNCMAFSHFNQSKDGCKKWRRVFDTYSMDMRQEQLQAVYKVWYEHSIAMITSQSKTSLYEDYFTMPFIVLDKLFHTSGFGSKEFNLLDGNEKALLSVDATIHKGFSQEEPIVITRQSLESLLPGNKIDESVCDLCLKWWVYARNIHLYLHIIQNLNIM